jgi:hypothetical protein
MAEGRAAHQAGLDRMTAARAFVTGRNMFGPVRGDFVTDGIESALIRACEAAGDGEVSVHARDLSLLS